MPAQKPRPVPGDDDRAHLVVAVGALERLDQLGAHRFGDVFRRSGRFSVIVEHARATS